jgi:hypothetical protein
VTIQIEPIECDGQFWVRLTMDGCAMKPHGAFPTKDEAEATAYQLAAICRSAFHQPVAIGGHLLAPTAPRVMKRRRERS